jgi:hypothetical protein
VLDDILARLSGLPAADRKALETETLQATRHLPFVPSPGPQTTAYLSNADILLYGGKQAGGKSALLIGLAVNEHKRSLIVRREFVDLEGIIDNAKGMLGTSEGFVGGSRPKYRKPDGGVIHFEGIGSKDGHIDSGKQGTARDFIGVDEAAQLPEDAIRMLLGWVRSTDPGQRCRMVLASNPPMDETGDWLVEFFGPWLDKRHPKPAEPGELRWFVMDGDGESREVDGPDPVEIDNDGKLRSPHSRTFVPADAKDNPFIDAEDYQRRLEMMPEPNRTILMTGDFMYARVDDANQVIPTEWIRAAQARWQPLPLGGIPMCALGVDVAQGGSDYTTIAPRYDGSRLLSRFLAYRRLQAAKLPLSSSFTAEMMPTLSSTWAAATAWKHSIFSTTRSCAAQ